MVELSEQLKKDFPSLDSIKSPLANTWVGNSPMKTKISSSRIFQLPFDQQKSSPIKGSIVEICDIIEKETKTTIEASRSGVNKTLTFVVKGSEDQIMEARKKIWSKFAETISINVPVQEEHLGIIIGAAGSKIQGLMRDTMTQIHVPRPSYQGNILVSGNLDAVQLAKEKIQALIHERINKTSGDLSLERHQLHFLLKKLEIKDSASLAASLSEQFKINAKRTVAVDGRVKFSFSGEKDAVKECVDDLGLKIKELRIKAVKVEMPRALVRHIKKKQIEAETGCIFEPSACVVWGPEDGIIGGLRAIFDQTQHLDCKSISLDPIHKGYLFKKQIDRIKWFERQFGLSFAYSEDKEELSLEGERAPLALAVSEIRGLVEDFLENASRSTLSMRQEVVKHLIGKRGSMLNQLEDRFGVYIYIPKPGNDRQQGLSVTILGENHEEAKAMIATFNVIRSVSVGIEDKYHGNLIGIKGSRIRVYEEKYPNTHFHFEGNEVQVRGPEKESEEAAAELEMEVERLRRDGGLLGKSKVEVSLCEKEIASDGKSKKIFLKRSSSSRRKTGLGLGLKKDTLMPMGCEDVDNRDQGNNQAAGAKDAVPSID